MADSGAGAATVRLAPDAGAFGDAMAQRYRHIAATTMHDLPVYNDRLAVEAIGFRRHNDGIVGIMTTPWFMNVVWVPDGQRLEALTPGATVVQNFTIGTLDFVVGELDGIGRFASCSLFSPMFDFADMDFVHATAHAALDTLLAEPALKDADAPEDDASHIDRRALLRGRLRGPPS